MKLLTICHFVFSLFLSMSLIFILGIYCMMIDHSVLVEWELFNLKCYMVMILILDLIILILDLISLIFMSIVMYISIVDSFKMYILVKKLFYYFVLMFFSMGFLMITLNLISIFLGWDGLGLVSCCLVIYYQNVNSCSAGVLTTLSNSIGDVAIFVSIAWMLNFGGWNNIYCYYIIHSSFEMKLITVLIVLAAVTKWAQIPFSWWLPAAMVAPTPVFALVHSSTLVTASVYLLIRFSPMLNIYNYGWFLLLVGCMTMFMAGLGANFEFDLKKIIALSTLSQLGLMMSILAMGYSNLAFFHLLSHALFKALLFMCAGSMIHNLKDSQDIRFMGSIVNFMPLTSVCFNVSSLSLCGMPFLAGFYSKDLILEMVCLKWINCLIFFMYFFSTGKTASYSFRLFYYSMSGDNNFYSNFSFNDKSFYISFEMIFLLFIAVLGGSLLSWLIFPIPCMIVLPYYLKILTITVVILGSYFGYLIFKSNFTQKLFSMNILSFMSFMGSLWFMPLPSNTIISYFPLKFGYYSLKSFDYSWGEILGGQGLYSLFIYMNKYIQSGYDFNFKNFLLTFIFWMYILNMLFLI
nr:NADH dehydrogenase subunit 5 [Kingdonella sp.]